MSRRLVRVAVGVVATLALSGGLFVGAASAAPPPSVFGSGTPPRNDQFANPVRLSPNPTVFNISPVAGEIRTATAERGEPNHAGFGTGGTPCDQSGLAACQSVWYTWTAPRRGAIEFNTCNSHFDTELGIYQTPLAPTVPTFANVIPVGQNDDADPFPYCGPDFPLFFNSRVVFQAEAGRTYRIAVDGFFPEGFTANSAFFLNYRYCPTGLLQGCLGPLP